MMISDTVAVQAIIVIGAISTTLISVKYKNYRKEERETRDNPVDRREGIYDGYESLIKQLQTEINRYIQLVAELQAIILKKDSEIDKGEKTINHLTEELRQSHQRIEEMQVQIEQLKAKYN